MARDCNIEPCIHVTMCAVAVVPYFLSLFDDDDDDYDYNDMMM